ncbi:hypothetical protein UA08_00088 [Talaromyces atroroseus]|uniref:Exoribonuclease phosphorolytic domain-containing protein n=1 Tax=Talaromyces atroroseus TaxID=1441469 RepID=A0A225AWZ4_TALAT|nr:hypothetical protein UA08_00088 [Talaromyces atroroseus]OKL64133.1 hypothetical protein UA08_00088 [Talaromyces atroroseus]
MPLDTSTTYPLTKLRLDGRRWNELRLLQAQISTNPASSGSSYLSMGNTSIMCTVHGPHETGGGAGSNASEAVVDVDVNIAGFAGIDRKRRAGGSDRQSSQLSNTLKSAFQSHLHTYLYPHSTITVQVSVLSADGSLLAAAINACTLALVDAGIPMPGLLCGCTAGMSGSASTPAQDVNKGTSTDDSLDPILDLSLPEEQELPFITVGTTTDLPMGTGIGKGVGRERRRKREGNNDNEGVGDDDHQEEEEEEEEDYLQNDDDLKVSVLHMETRAHLSYLDTMLAVGVDGCKQIREILEGVVKGSSMGFVAAVDGGGIEDDEDENENEDGDIEVDEIMASDV